MKPITPFTGTPALRPARGRSAPQQSRRSDQGQSGSPRTPNETAAARTVMRDFMRHKGAHEQLAMTRYIRAVL